MSKWRWCKTLVQNTIPSSSTLKTTLKFGCLFTGSEWTQQVIIYKVWNGSFHTSETRVALDWGSIGRYAIWGFAIFPHILRRWYTFLDKVVVGKTVWKVALAKTAVDQAIFPIPILGSFYVFLSALEGKNDSMESLFEECNVKLWATLKARYCFMLPTQFINFMVIPPQHRVIYVGCTTFIWLNVLCIYKRLDINNSLFHK